MGKAPQAKQSRNGYPLSDLEAERNTLAGKRRHNHNKDPAISTMWIYLAQAL